MKDGRLLVGKVIQLVEMNEFVTNGTRYTQPVIYFADGSLLAFAAAEVERYGVTLKYYARKQ